MGIQEFPTLSAKLLEEAKRFQGYPKRVRRTARTLKFQQEVWDPVWKSLVEWRRTFEPKGADVAGSVWPPVLIDEILCREMLEEIPGMVERAGRISRLSLAGLPAGSYRHLREAADCYIRGLPLASIALSRAAVETPIRAAVAKTLGASSVRDEEFFKVLKELVPRTHIMSESDLRLAHQVRTAGNDVLHKGVEAALDEALKILEASRLVILSVARRSA